MALGFGTSGVRGLVCELTDFECALYTRAFTTYVAEAGSTAPVALAGDYRSSTPRIIRAIAHALSQHGPGVGYCGLIPTPAVAFHAMQRGQPSIMVTGSHIPDDRNGIKFYLPQGEVLKSDEPGILRHYQDLKGRVPAPGQASDPTEAGFASAFGLDGSLLPSVAADPPPPTPAALIDYRNRYLNWFPGGALRGMRVVVFEHSSVARDFLGELLAELGAQVIPVGRSERFIPVDTEAVRNPEELAEWVRSNRADALVSADGDGDRPLLVDDQGTLVRGDVMGILVSAFLQADSISAPISCNTALEKSGRFPRIDRTRIGSPFVIASMQKAIAAGCRRVVGYEANGGFLLGGDIPNPDGSAILKALPTRDAALPLLACLFEVASRRTRLSELVASLPARFTASGLLRDFPIETSKAILAAFQGDRRQAVSRLLEARFGRMEAIDFTDGVRMTFDGGEIVHLRPSGNAPEFRCYTESGSEAGATANNAAALDLVRDVLAREAAS